MATEKTTVATFHEESIRKGSDLVDTTQHISGDALLLGSDGQVRKLPVPSADPNDPLNFRRWQKVTIIVACCWFSIMSLALSGGLGAILGVFFEMYIPQGHTPTQIVWLLTFPSLFIGIGNFLILPMSIVFGRRPTFIVSVLALFAATIGSAVQNSFEAHLATRIIQGLATGATESLLPLMLTDISFIHERSQMFGWYWATQSLFSSALNLASSYEAAISWRWFYWVYVIAIAVGIFLVVFGAFETRYPRPVMAIDGQVVVTDEFGVTRVFSDQEAQTYLADHPHVAGEVTCDNDSIPQRKTYLQMLKPWNKVSKRPVHVILKTWFLMLESFSSPGILFAVLMSSITLGVCIGVSLTYDTVLSTNYHWAAKNVGLINIGGIIGSLFGMAYAGWPADRFAIWMARRNHGVHKPEHRLLVLIVPGILGFASLLLYGFTADGKQTWWGPYIGWTLLQTAFVSVLIISTTFASEAWPKNPGPAITVVVGSKNIVSFIATSSIQKMTAIHGYAWAFGVLAGIYGAIFLLGIPVYFLNPRWRKRFASGNGHN